VMAVTPPAPSSEGATASGRDVVTVPEAPPAIGNGAAGAGQTASTASSAAAARTIITAPPEPPDRSTRLAPPGNSVPEYSTRLASGNSTFDQPTRPAAGSAPGY